jgi:hypothetical protein
LLPVHQSVWYYPFFLSENQSEWVNKCTVLAPFNQSWLLPSLKIVTVSCTPNNWRISFFYTKNGYNGASMVHSSNNPLLQRTFSWNWIKIPNVFFCGKGFILGYIIYSWLLLCFQRDGNHFNQLNLLINLHDHM